MVDDTEEIVVDSESPSVGERLKAAREAKKISISEVAAQLRLTKETIINLEAEQWELLHGRAYARGYFSNYVKFLGLPERELLSAFNVEYKTTEAALLSSYQLNSTSRFPWVPVALFAIVLVITWFAYQQWQTSQDNLEIAKDTSSPWEYLEEEPGVDGAFDASVVKPLSEPIEEVVPEQEAVIETEETEQPVSESEIVLPEQQPEAELITEQQSQLDEELAELATDEVVQSEPTIELQFVGDSWVEIRDADRQALLNKTMKADENVMVSGKLPLSVTLGRASAVIIKYNDVVFDTSPYTEGDVARFVIEEES